jgi:hypothetical protein
VYSHLSKVLQKNNPKKSKKQRKKSNIYSSIPISVVIDFYLQNRVYKDENGKKSEL